MRFRVSAGRAKDDPEKLITPGLLYASKCDGRISVGLIAVGRWDWHVSLLFARIADAEKGPTEPERPD